MSKYNPCNAWCGKIECMDKCVDNKSITKAPNNGTDRKKSKQEVIDYVNEWAWYVGIKGNNPERASEGMQTPEEYFKDLEIIDNSKSVGGF